jgi:hypothetical protein
MKTACFSERMDWEEEVEKMVGDTGIEPVASSV